MKKTLLLLTAAVGLFSTSCIKIKKESNINELSDTELRLVGKWRTTYSKLFNYDNGVLVSESDAILSIDSCKRDDLTDFRSDRSLYGDANTVTCYSTEPQTYLRGTWKVSTENTEKLFLMDAISPTGFTSTMPFTITKLTSNRMEIYRDSTIVVDGHTLSSKSFAVFER